MTTISFEHIRKVFAEAPDTPAFRQVQAIDDVSLRVDSGSVLAVLGPSGCGKSTLLRIAAGLMPPDGGRVLYDGVPLNDVPNRERGIGFVFQEGALIPHWQAKKSVGFFMALRRREEEVPPRVAEIANITGFGLDVLMERRPAHLSGGEKQRVSIARALTRDLTILLMDEPFANIDTKLRLQARNELRHLMQEFPVTSIYVTHDQVEAVALARRVAVMNDGKLEQIASYQQLYEQPVNLFVAQFIGTQPINVFPGFVISHKWKGDSFKGLPIRKDLAEGTRILAAIRPEYITPTPDDGAGVAEGRVEKVTPYFNERYQLVEVSANGERWQMHVPADFAVQPKDRIRSKVDPRHLLYFDSKTQLRIG
ncbi:MAG: ABC transporter ATP-binding protein [Phototrophicaceae bacterium]|jgi:multiple sugar transport system ATP-binding protein